jgi:hypothetical protein
VIEKAQVDAELMRLTRLRSAHAEEQYRIRRNLLQSRADAEAFTMRLANLRQDIAIRQDTSGDNFHIEVDGQTINNRGIAGELIVRRAAKLQGCFGDDVRIVRQGEIEEKLDLTKNQAPSQADAEPAENNEEKNSEAHKAREATKRRLTMRV